jgi:hypothetical protein
MNVSNTRPHQLTPSWLVQQMPNFTKETRHLVLCVLGQMAGDVRELVQFGFAQATQPVKDCLVHLVRVVQDIGDPYASGNFICLVKGYCYPVAKLFDPA